MYAKDTMAHPRFPTSENLTDITAYRQILVLLRKLMHNYLLGSEVDHSSCVEHITCSTTAVEPSMNQLLIDVGVRGVSSM